MFSDGMVRRDLIRWDTLGLSRMVWCVRELSNVVMWYSTACYRRTFFCMRCNAATVTKLVITRTTSTSYGIVQQLSMYLQVYCMLVESTGTGLLYGTGCQISRALPTNRSSSGCRDCCSGGGGATRHATHAMQPQRAHWHHRGPQDDTEEV